MRKLIPVLIAAMVSTASCASGNRSTTDPLGTHDSRVLFMGNSLTYQNDLPGVFRDLAFAGGYDVGVQSLAYPNVALIDFLSDAAAMKVVDQGWNYVVMQQGTTSIPVCRDTLVLAAKLINARIRSKGGVPALMMSWPSSDRLSLFPAVHESFALAAQTVNGVFLPVGDAWLETWKLNPGQQLFDLDGYHPSQAATYLAALVIYEKLTGNDPRSLPVDIHVGASQFLLPPDVVRQLQEAAHNANQLPVPKVVVPATPVATPITC